MSAASRPARLIVLVTMLAVCNAGGAAAWHAPSAPDQDADHCRAMRATSGMQHCRQAAITCCTEDQRQPDASLPQVPASDGVASAHASQVVPVSIAPEASPAQTGTAWYARPPTHGYSSKSLLVLQSVLLI